MLGSIVLVISALGIWPAGVESTRSPMVDADAGFDAATKVFDQADREDYLYPPPAPDSQRGFYPYRRGADGDIEYRWWNGKGLAGRSVDYSIKDAYDWLVAQGVGPETLGRLAKRFGGGVDGLLVATLVLLLAYATSENVQAPTTSPSPSPGEASIDWPSNYRFVWHFEGDTYGAFDGTFSGGPSGWKYRSTSVCNCWTRWHCFKEDPTKVGHATCDIKGALESEKPNTIKCTARWTLPDRPTWTSVNAVGFFHPVNDPKTGELLHYEFHGNGYLDDQDKYPDAKLDFEPQPQGSGCPKPSD